MQTLTEFFAHSQADVTLYSLGRRVAPITLETFDAFEREQESWPLPWNGQAQLACALRWAATGHETVVWFLTLPLDEQGRLLLAPRDAFLERLLETLGQPGEEGLAAPVQNLMQDNPIAMEPELHQRALLHARLAHHYGQPESRYADSARRYLAGDNSLNWQMIGLQGLADVVVAPDDALTAALAERIAGLPDEVIIALCYLYEHGDTPDALLDPLYAGLATARASANLERYCALLRAVLGSHSSRVGPWLDALLEDDDAMAADCLAAIAARGWHHLEHEARLSRFLERLADCEQIQFRRVIRDLALIPRLRLPIVMMLRQADATSPIGRRVAEWKA